MADGIKNGEAPSWADIKVTIDGVESPGLATLKGFKALDFATKVVEENTRTGNAIQFMAEVISCGLKSELKTTYPTTSKRDLLNLSGAQLPELARKDLERLAQKLEDPIIAARLEELDRQHHRPLRASSVGDLSSGIGLRLQALKSRHHTVAHAEACLDELHTRVVEADKALSDRNSPFYVRVGRARRAIQADTSAHKLDVAEEEEED